jgi:hypothetical protein
MQHILSADWPSAEIRIHLKYISIHGGLCGRCRLLRRRKRREIGNAGKDEAGSHESSKHETRILSGFRKSSGNGASLQILEVLSHGGEQRGGQFGVAFLGCKPLAVVVYPIQQIA